MNPKSADSKPAHPKEAKSISGYEKDYIHRSSSGFSWQKLVFLSVPINASAIRLHVLLVLSDRPYAHSLRE